MGGEQIAGARRIEGHGEGDLLPGHMAARPLQHGECGMAIVQVEHIGLQAGGFQQAPAADAQHQFLAQAHLVVAAIEFAGDQPRDGWIGGVIGIEQQQAIEADPGLPAAQPDLQPRQLYGQPQRRAAGVMQRLDGHLPGVVDRVQRLLSAVRADALAEVAVLPEHAHRGDRHAEVAGGLELVPGDVAEAAGVDRQGFAEHVFHGKVGDSREAFAVLLAGEPGRLLQPCLARLDDAVHQAVAVDAAQQRLQLLLWHRAEDQAGIAGQRPEVVVDQLPEVIVLAGPANRLVESQFAQGVGREGGAIGCRCQRNLSSEPVSAVSSSIGLARSGDNPQRRGPASGCGTSCDVAGSSAMVSAACRWSSRSASSPCCSSVCFGSYCSSMNTGK